MCKAGIKKFLNLSFLLILLLLPLSALHPAHSLQPVFANAQPVFYPGPGAATIDGVIDPTEWATAASLSLPMQFGDTQLTGTFYVMQSSTDLYFGFTIDDDEYTQDPVGKYGIKDDKIDIFFDGNNNGILDEIGENVIIVHSQSPWLEDNFRYNVAGNYYQDINDGGIANGEGLSTRTNTMNHFEVRFPLCSSDTDHDFCLQTNDTLGFWIKYWDAFYDPAFDYDPMAYPGTETWDSLALIVIGTGGPIQSFQDVPPSHWAHMWIENLYNNGVTSGCSQNPMMYCPEFSVTRSEMAKFLLIAKHGKGYTPPLAGSDTGFGDVPISHWAADWIKQLAAEGLTSGCGGGNYCPNIQVTRAQMAKFLLTAKHGPGYTPPPVGSSTGFNDVPISHWAAAWIKQLHAEGITSGCGNGNYCPDAPVKRSEMAKFIVITFNFPY